MSFVNYKPKIEDGDTVILFLGHDNMLPLKIQAGETYQTRYGALRHSDIIGKQYGCKIKCRQGYLHVLHVTPELWTLNLPHRTQILYSTDISMVTMQLDLQPGSVVVESGTGSGSLSHAIIRSIAPSGHLHTFDFHAERVQKAQEEFSEHGVGCLVTCRQRDACSEGFDLDNVADAVFLDLPKPWEALPHAAKALKQGGRICSFSPCIEQVQRSCTTMRDLGFTDIVTMECLLRTFEVRSCVLQEPNMGPCQNTEKQDVVNVSVQASPSESLKPEKHKGEGDQATKSDQSELFSFKSGVPRSTMPGHTGYLTFATYNTA